MSRIKRGRLRRGFGLIDDDVNPMEGAINIVDAMLVFACGLMLSLVIFWNVDLKSGMKPVTQGPKIDTTNEIEHKLDNTTSGSGYQEVGKVYRDPATGQLYLAENNSSPQAVGSGGDGQTK